MEKQNTTVRVAGREYAIASAESAAYLTRVAGYVDRRMTEVTLASRKTREDVAVMVALTMADELMKAQDEVTRLRAELVQLRTGESK